MRLAVVLALAYFIGAFPSSVVLGRLFRGIDLRRHGSGNAGATNAWRILGWKIGLAVLVLDAAKGIIAAVLLPRLPIGPLPVGLTTAALASGCAAVLGHVFPVYIGFRGGKGVATTAGMLVALIPIPAASAAGAFVLAAVASGRISLGSLLGAWVVPLTATLLAPSHPQTYPPPILALTYALALFITITHRSNIRRLWNGTERVFPQLQVWRRPFRNKPDKTA
jgi:glycerol-3-phosphate acyltransferase PlsY